MRNFLFFSIIIALLATGVSSAAFEPIGTGKLFIKTDHMVVKSYEIVPRLIKQPNGPFTAIIFDEYAHGIYLGIVYFDRMSNPTNGEWSIDERLWQDKKWGRDITSLYWSADGKYLYVGTSHVYGNGGVFQLNLLKKESKKIFPRNNNERKDISSTEIIKVDDIKRKMIINVSYNDDEKVEPVEISLK